MKKVWLVVKHVQYEGSEYLNAAFTTERKAQKACDKVNAEYQKAGYSSSYDNKFEVETFRLNPKTIGTWLLPNPVKI